MTTRIITILTFLFLSFIQNEDDPVSNTINEKLAAWSWDNPLEKAYIHTDKPFYVAGEDIWFKVYLMVGPYHIPDTLSSVLMVELIDPEKEVFDRKLVRIREGLGYGDFNLPSDMTPGKYILRAYTQYMRNYDPAFYFRKVIDILPVTGYSPEILAQNVKPTGDTRVQEKKYPVKLRFFPEGGDMVEGLQNYVAFKATDLSGKGLYLEGTVKNSKNEKVAGFKTRKFGLGVFKLNPEPEEKYYAETIYHGDTCRFTLPAPKTEGYVMHINKSGDNVYIWVRNNMDLDMKGSFVTGQFRGFPFININATPGKKYIYFAFSVKDVPSGILHFTFFDSSGIPHCERLVYTENKTEQINVLFDPDKEKYNKRDHADIFLNCTDHNGNPILTNISLSVTNTSIVRDDDSRGNIKSYFNLESDLKGSIEQPGYYFNPENEDRFELLDNLMLTHGWRRFTWKKILNEQPAEKEHEPEMGFTIEGQLFNFYNKDKPQPGNVRVFIFENQFYYNEVESDSTGVFRLKGMNIIDSSEVVIQAWRFTDEKTKKRNKKPPESRNDYAIKVKPRDYAGINPEYWPLDSDTPDSVENYLEHSRLILKVDSAYEGRTIIMDELTIEDEEISDDPFDRPGKLHEEPSSRVVPDSLPASEESLGIFDLLRRYVPGLTIRGMPPEVQIRLRGASSLSGDNEPLLLFDGMPIESDFIYHFPVSEIAFVDVLTTGEASIYGGGSENGVIAIYTRTEPSPFTPEGRRGVHNFVHPGYYPAREFYTPDYDANDEKRIKPDYRNTLYWNPTLTTDDNGDINFSFFTSDEAGEYRIHIEGMTYSGIPVVRDYYFTVD